MKDYLIRGLALNDEIRFFATRTTKLVEEIRLRHNACPTAIAAVGRTATATAMIGAMQKSGDIVDIRVRGSGPIGQILATANEDGQVRAYATNMQLHLPSKGKGKLDVAGVVGTEGEIIIIKDLGLQEKYTTSSPLVSGEIAEDFTYYFAKSEQVASAVSLGVLVDTDNSILAAGGFIIQVLPFASEETISKLEEVLKNIRPISTLINEDKSLEDIVKILFDGNYRILKENKIEFKCSCSKEKYAKALVTLGREELEDMLKDEHIETVCAFCNEKYEFSQKEIKELIDKL
ncbi:MULTISPECIES: Hsp33 family molecular chaperone HslO [unclassified Gemella]|uniref:Hsp33 family molecular chaperone HslO n=1 Tax=unclassified Gemella TaxID=2624949 RepID=UPI001C047569|nr:MULTISPECIES: Hsp33 family molecular chaperone HslO [unclassified Gemella]MBU0279150.1 Hsp33 family molecular chaperone HslO [Gemella sp. zg-1178]QWQ38524.1 Hsp33 family molecular chaperone HslO [Gemella sp. zg-570]